MNDRFLLRFFLVNSFFMLLWSAYAFSQGLDSEMQHIQSLVEAHDNQSALNRYESLLEDVHGWQKAIIQYNIGTVLLMDGNAEKALARYRDISAADVDLPLLRQRLDANSALARLLVVEKRITDLRGRTDTNAGDYSQLIVNLRETLELISVAEKSNCALIDAERGTVCEALPEIDDMRVEAKRALSSLLESYSKYNLENVSLQGGSGNLLIGLEAVLDNLAFLKQISNDQSLKSQYVELVLNQAKSWNPLWEALQKVVQNASIESSQKKQLEDVFDQFQQEFSTGVRLLQRNEIAASQAAFENTKTAINALMQLIFGSSDIKYAVEQLLTLYDLVLVQEPLQELSLNALSHVQKQLQPLVDTQGVENMKKLYGHATSDLNTGQQAVEAFQLLQGRMFVLAAQDYIRRMALEINSLPKVDPVNVLLQTIEAEKLALQLNTLKQSSEGTEAPLKDSSALLQLAQQHVFSYVEAFFKSAITQQIAEFRAQAPLDGPDMRCQTSPWDTVIPLVVQGKKSAQNAQGALENTSSSLSKIADWQTEAIKKWQEALAQLKEPKKQHPNEKPQDNKKQKEEDNKQQKEEKKQQGQGAQKEKQSTQGQTSVEPKPMPGKADINSVLRLVQEMENDDRSKPEIIPQTVDHGDQSRGMQEARPW